MFGFERPDGVFVALKPIVAALGLDWSGQLQRIKRDPILSEGMGVMPTPFGEQDATCLRLDLLNGWLFGIDAARVKEAGRKAVVLLYQRECYRALAAHFRAGKPHLAIGDAKAEPISVRRALVTEARQTFSTMSARELWVELGLPMVPSMSALPTQGDLFRGGANGNRP